MNRTLSSKVLNLESVMKDAITNFLFILKLRSTLEMGKMGKKIESLYHTIKYFMCKEKVQ